MIKRKSRKSMRLHGFDYASNAAYYVTICAKDKREIFGKIVEEKVILYEAGEKVAEAWAELPWVEQGIETLDFCLMPNHLHGILLCHHTPMALGEIIRRFKARVSRDVGQSIWQRNYYEHIIRDEKDYLRVAEYIALNPLNWELDEENQKVWGAANQLFKAPLSSS